MKEFVFNENNVCTNPNTTQVLNEKYFTASIKTAEKDGKWYFGCDWTNSYLNGYSGYGSGASLYGPTFDSENEAIRYAVNQNILPALQHILSELPNASLEYDEDGNLIRVNKSEKISLCNHYINRCNEFINDTYQLSLF